MLGRNGWTVVTGGGGGLMQSVSLGGIDGAKQAQAQAQHNPDVDDFPMMGQFVYSDFRNKELDDEPVTEEQMMEREYVLRVDSIYDCDAYIALPGGYGTTLEVFQLCRAMQSGQMKRKPLYLVGKTHATNMAKLLHDGRKSGLIAADEVYHTCFDHPVQAAIGLCKLKSFA